MYRLAFLLILCLGVASCIEEPQIETPEIETNTEFDFSLVSETIIDLSFTQASGEPLNGVLVEVWNKTGETDQLLFKAATNSSGRIYQALNLPTYLEKVVVEANYIGIPNSIWLPVRNKGVTLTYKGALDPGQLTTPPSSANLSVGTFAAAGASESSSAEVTFNYVGTYNNQGVPDYLEPERDVISSQLLQYINASLPEAQPVPQYHPTFLANGKKTTLDIEETADVWVTFVHEGAGYRNAIGFYTYDTSTPPQSINDISQVNVIFPNLSYAGSGGGLYSGDKVLLGRFDPGTSIGLVLMANGWNGSNSEDYYHMVYADKNLNPEATDELRQHNVLLWDSDNELFLVGFEDILRDDNACDNDFNDAILFVSSNPVTAISTENVNPVDKPGTLDQDGDGINDILDEYPNDATRAYNSFYPSSTTFGTFSFEDNWPNYGDYDFNDLVIDYQFKHILNADNKVVQMDPSFKVRAIGAGYRNGFGFATDLTPSDVTSVAGSSLNSGIINTNGNGTEAGQSNAVFIVSDNVHDLFSSGGFINTVEGENTFDPQTVTLSIQLSTPKTYAEIGAVPYNPFLIISQNRGREVHLPGYAPTDLVDTSFFGTLDDDTDVAQGIYYRSKTDLPWAIHLPESFAYPKEKSDIRQGHIRFNDWSRSLGFSYMDWYRNQNGYRSTQHLYNGGN